MMRRRELMGMQGRLETVTGPIVTVNDALARNAKSLVVNFAPIQAAGTPAPDNVLPISGWTGVTGYRTGKNLCDTPTSADIILSWPNSGSSYSKTIGNLPQEQTFTLQANVTKDLGENISNTRFSLLGKRTSGVFLSTGTPLGVHSTNNEPNDSGELTLAHNVRGLTTYGAEFDNIQLEVGATPTPYEPYSGATYPVDWTDTAGTVYGGYVDLVSGVLVAEWVSSSLSSYTWLWSSAYNCYYCNVAQFYTPLRMRDRAQIKCSRYKYVGPYTALVDKSCAYIYLNNIAVSDTSYADVSSFVASLSGAQFVYELATPITYQLTPQTIAMLKGTNNVWSNANGDVSLTYYAQ